MEIHITLHYFNIMDWIGTAIEIGIPFIGSNPTTNEMKRIELNKQ